MNYTLGHEIFAFSFRLKLYSNTYQILFNPDHYFNYFQPEFSKKCSKFETIFRTRNQNQKSKRKRGSNTWNWEYNRKNWMGMERAWSAAFISCLALIEEITQKLIDRIWGGCQISNFYCYESLFMNHKMNLVRFMHNMQCRGQNSNLKLRPGHSGTVPRAGHKYSAVYYTKLFMLNNTNPTRLHLFPNLV